MNYSLFNNTGKYIQYLFDLREKDIKILGKLSIVDEALSFFTMMCEVRKMK